MDKSFSVIINENKNIQIEEVDEFSASTSTFPIPEKGKTFQVDLSLLLPHGIYEVTTPYKSVTFPLPEEVLRSEETDAGKKGKTKNAAPLKEKTSEKAKPQAVSKGKSIKVSPGRSKKANGTTLKKKVGSQSHAALTAAGSADEYALDPYELVRLDGMQKFVGKVFAKKDRKVCVLAYRRYADLDIEYEDGTIVRHCQGSNLQVGSFKAAAENATPTVGETSRAFCGMPITITKVYPDKVDVAFEDGTPVQGVSYRTFVIGDIPHPTYKDLAVYTNLPMRSTVKPSDWSQDESHLVEVKSRFNNETDMINKEIVASLLSDPEGNTSVIYTYDGKPCHLVKGTIRECSVRMNGGAVLDKISTKRFLSGNFVDVQPRGDLPKGDISALYAQTFTMKDGKEVCILGGTNYANLRVKTKEGLVLDHQNYNYLSRGYYVCKRSVSKTFLEKEAIKDIPWQDDVPAGWYKDSSGHMILVDAYRNDEDIDLDLESGESFKHTDLKHLKELYTR